MAWLRPQTLEEALKWLDEYRPTVVCGGTDLFVNWPARKANYTVNDWLDVRRLPELNVIERDERGLAIGAAVTAAQIWQDKRLRCFPALQQAARVVGGWQIQNRASVGGNLANASPAADMAVPLAAAKASVRVAGLRGTRDIPIAEFLLGPRRTALQPGELIVSVHVPARMLDVPQAFLRHDQRGATDISIVSAALIGEGDSKSVDWASAAVGAAHPVPLTAPDLEPQWQGAMSGEKLKAVAEAYAARCRPISDVRASAEYRRAMVSVFLERAARTAWNFEAPINRRDEG